MALVSVPSAAWCARCTRPAASAGGAGARRADGSALMPCGRCRQVLLEHGGPELLIDHPAGPRPLKDLLPDAFGPDDLASKA